MIEGIMYIHFGNQFCSKVMEVYKWVCHYVPSCNEYNTYNVCVHNTNNLNIHNKCTVSIFHNHSNPLEPHPLSLLPCLSPLSPLNPATDEGRSGGNSRRGDRAANRATTLRSVKP